MRRPRLVRDGSRGSYRSSWNRRRNATRRLEASLEALTLFKVALTRRADRLAGGQIRRSRMWTLVSNPIFFQKRRPISFRACVYRSTSSTRRDRNHARASPTSARAHRDPRPGRPGCEALWTRYVPPALPAQRLRPRSRTSLPLEGRLSLLEECAEALLRIGHREEAILQFAFEGEALVHRHLEAFRDGPLDEANRASGVLRIRQAFCEGHRLVPELRPREDAVEQAPLERFLRGDHAARRHQVDRAALPDEPRQPLRAAGPGEYAQP